MDGARKKLFSGSAFAEQQNGGIGRGDALRHLAGFFHRGMLADDPRKAVARGVFFAQQKIFAQQFLLLRGAFEQQLQMIEVDRLLDEIERAFFHGGHGFFDRSVGGHENEGKRRLDAVRFAQAHRCRSCREVSNRRGPAGSGGLRILSIAVFPSGASSTV